MASEHVIEVTDASFQNDVLDSSVPVIVDFWAPWCAPCRAIAPILDEVATAFAGRVKVAKVNVDDSTAMATRFRVTAVPTVLLIKGGEVVEQVVGSKTKAFFTELVERHL